MVQLKFTAWKPPMKRASSGDSDPQSKRPKAFARQQSINGFLQPRVVRKVVAEQPTEVIDLCSDDELQPPHSNQQMTQHVAVLRQSFSETPSTGPSTTSTGKTSLPRSRRDPPSASVQSVNRGGSHDLKNTLSVQPIRHVRSGPLFIASMGSSRQRSRKASAPHASRDDGSDDEGDLPLISLRRPRSGAASIVFMAHAPSDDQSGASASSMGYFIAPDSEASSSHSFVARRPGRLSDADSSEAVASTPVKSSPARTRRRRPKVAFNFAESSSVYHPSSDDDAAVGDIQPQSNEATFEGIRCPPSRRAAVAVSQAISSTFALFSSLEPGGVPKSALASGLSAKTAESADTSQQATQAPSQAVNRRNSSDLHQSSDEDDDGDDENDDEKHADDKHVSGMDEVDSSDGFDEFDNFGVFYEPSEVDKDQDDNNMSDNDDDIAMAPPLAGHSGAASTSAQSKAQSKAPWQPNMAVFEGKPPFLTSTWTVDTVARPSRPPKWTLQPRPSHLIVAYIQAPTTPSSGRPRL
ncbi:hypothetical protein FB567DRAFT_618144 [Paraphoma chrysanthemicola]|uniref:Uncharacterized protein n=1 Tax=Paraphoma chrysanthemicola TaxID=798071 RepID=A0A8K0R9A8_9PLEO|nr:hypothetical protein FB567DRAFT_618144 [Paraphoma chrysanthemicola]